LEAKPQPRRGLALLGGVAALGAVSFLFYRRQRKAGQLGGPMSVAKLLWLDYALTAWFVVPFCFWRSPRIAPGLRRVYGAHLGGFAARGAAELWMLYVTRSWIPPYGIGHDLFAIGLISMFLPSVRAGLPEEVDPADRAALRFLTSVRAGLACEILFAWLFYHAVERDTSGVWFASTDPAFERINRLTWAVVLVAYPDLGRTLWEGRDALFPVLEGEKTVG
jgi:hypothetical protein